MNANRESFEQTALPHLDSMYRMATRLTRDTHEAEDLVQDAMARAYRFWDRFRPGTNARAWLLTILRNTFITRYHKQNRAKSLAQEVEREMDSIGAASALGRTTETQTLSPEQALAQKVERGLILEALDSLPEDYRTAIVLADLEGLAYREVAEAMDCPVGTVMSRIYRGRKILYKLLLEHAVERGFANQGDPNPRARKSADTEQDPVFLSDYRHKRSFRA